MVLQTTPHEVVFNHSDVTAPHPLVGDMTTQYVGLPVLNASGAAVVGGVARVVESEHWAATELAIEGLPYGGSVQVPFHLVPKLAAEEAEQQIPVTLRVEGPGLEYSYETEVVMTARTDDQAYIRTRLSGVDRSVQYYGVRNPTDYDPDTSYALVLSLHGAGVEGIGQASSYGAKDWAYIVAPTNRRPFGFDWEEWGRLDGIEAADHATEQFGLDPTRAYVTGHSMGGHGTWQFGVHFAHRFAVVGPSAGWSSFYSYGGSAKPTGPFARARASSDTNVYTSNLTDHPVYIIHGSADNNVPITEGYAMFDLVSQVTDDIEMHVQEGAGHWWDGDLGAGADCVDWPPLFDLMQERTLDPWELDFQWKTPSPFVVSTNSYVMIQSEADPYQDVEVTSMDLDGTVTLTTTNVRAMVLDGAALMDKGVTALMVDGEALDLVDGDMEIGPQTGKTADVHGPLNQVFQRPFCFVFPDAGSPHLEGYAAFMASGWNIYGNGAACAMPLSKLDDDVKATNNIVYVGVPKADIPALAGHAFDWTEAGISLGPATVPAAALAFVFRDGDHLGAVFATSPGSEHLLYRYTPWSSRSGLPDYFAWVEGGGVAGGFFDMDWQYDINLGVGP